MNPIVYLFLAWLCHYLARENFRKYGSEWPGYEIFYKTILLVVFQIYFIIAFFMEVL